MKDLLPYLAGAASAFVAQFLIQVYVVPLTETRKRRLERWEQDVLGAGELLTGTISDLAGAAQSAQQNFRWTMAMKDTFPAAIRDPEGFAGYPDKLKEQARTATRALNDQVVFRSDWRIERVTMYRAGDLVVKFAQASGFYMIHLLKPGPDDWADLSDDDFAAWWTKERDLRTDVITAIRHLAYDKRPLRTSLRMRLRRLKYGLRKVRSQPAESKPAVPAPVAVPAEKDTAAWS